MNLRKNLLKRFQLYLILDKQSFTQRSLENIYVNPFACGIGMIQLRDKVSAKSAVLKFAVKLSRRLSGCKTLFIVNDYIEVALISGADGVHLGQKDLPLKQARKILGQDKIIGISCYNLRQAQAAQKDGADYIGIGPIYATSTKPGVKPIGLSFLRELKNKIKIPYFAIGNICADNINEITAAGARRVAVCRAILEADNPKAAAKELFKKIK